jgi:amino acid transporter
VSRVQLFKRVLLGRTMASGELEHTLLPKTLALPVFSSDPLSSNAYATQEILLVLGLAGAASLGLVLPIAVGVACLLAIVVTSYRQTVHAYPAGGGAYRVSRENLGVHAGLTAACALLSDYVLTVSVSVTAGVDAIVSAADGVEPFKVEVAIVAILLVMVANLRGVKESGTLFAIPAYGFVASVYVMLIFGFAKCLGGCPQASSAGAELHPEATLSLFLILKAFAAGTTALTGVEAIADGVQAFRYPHSRNAATTLSVMGALAISMFLGISWLADQTNVVYTHGASMTVVAQIADAVFSGGFFFYVVQIMTAGILFLAANTAYQDFPRLSSILAQDNFMPRQFINRGDRLVFSNGVMILTALAILLVVAFDANLNSLIQLYLVGVFISFTLSQTGMVLRARKLRPPGWKRGAAISGFGAVVTGIVFFVIVSTKFTGGAWIVIAALPILVYLMLSIHRHYADVARQLAHPERRPHDRRLGNHHFVILVEDTGPATQRAIGYMRSIRAADRCAISFKESRVETWPSLAPDIPLENISGRGSEFRALREYLRDRRGRLGPDDFLTVVVPELLTSRSLLEVFRRPRLHRLKASLLGEPGVQVLDVPVVASDVAPSAESTHEPARNYVVVLIAGVHNATLQAMEYGEALRPTDLRAVSFGHHPEETEKLGDKWLAGNIPFPLEIEASPFRDIGASMVKYLRQFKADGINRVVTVVLPEFVVHKRRHQLLHGQTALLVKRHLLFERGVVAVSVPYPLEGQEINGSV